MKKKHIVLLSLAAILIIVTCYIWNDLVTLFKIGKLVMSDKNDIEQLLMEELNDNPLDIGLDSNIAANENEVVNEPQNLELNPEQKQQIEKPSNQQQVNEKNSSNTVNMKSYKPETSLEQEIVNKYTAQFNALKNESMSRLKSLALEAAGEYKNLSSKKSSAVLSLAYSYLNKGKALEEECDKKFEAILSNMEKELKENNLSLAAVEVAKKEYQTQKNVQKSYLLKEALGKIKN